MGEGGVLREKARRKEDLEVDSTNTFLNFTTPLLTTLISEITKNSRHAEQQLKIWGGGGGGKRVTEGCLF